MKHILGIIASPRKLGNCELMVKEITRHVPEPHDVSLVRLQDFDIKPCKACYRCLFDKERCVIGDDLNKVLDQILNADAIIVAAPTYLLGASAVLKLFQDRGLAFSAHIERLWGKPAIGVGIAGIPGKEGRTLLDIQSFLTFLKTDIKQTKLIFGALPGEIFFNEANRQTAKELGQSLFGEKTIPKQPCCPLCGGDTFRFLENGQVRCMLCSNAGSVEWTSRGPVVSIERGEHEMVLTKEDVMYHQEWLRNMKHRFVEEKSRIRDIALPFKDGWTWIRP